jgi:hypothetical protein
MIVHQGNQGMQEEQRPRQGLKEAVCAGCGEGFSWLQRRSAVALADHATGECTYWHNQCFREREQEASAQRQVL